MAISVTNIGTNHNTSGATLAITVPVGGVPIGALIVLGVADASVAVPGGSATDSKSNTYTSIVGADNNNSTLNGSGELFYAFNVAALVSGDTITYTKAITGANCTISAFYATGIDTSSPLDTAVTASATGTGTTPSVTSGTPAMAGELFVGMISEDVNKAYTQDTTHSWVAPFTASTASAPGIGGGNQVNAGTGTKIFSPTIGAAGNWAALVAGFKPAAVALPDTGAFVMP